MPIQAGDNIPSARVAMMTDGQPVTVDARDIFTGHTVALFGVPGAFTPTCSARHLPGFVDSLDELGARGVDRVACVSVNDAYVMQAWARDTGAPDILMIADGNADFVQALGLASDASAFCMGMRSRRFSLLAEDCKVLSLFVEEPGDFRVSSAEYLLANARFRK